MPMDPHLNPREPFGLLPNLAGLLISHTIRWRIGGLDGKTFRTPSLHLHVRRSIVPNGPKQGPKSPRNGPFDTFVPRTCQTDQKQNRKACSSPIHHFSSRYPAKMSPGTSPQVRALRHRSTSGLIAAIVWASKKSATKGAQWRHAPRQHQTNPPPSLRSSRATAPKTQPAVKDSPGCSPL